MRVVTRGCGRPSLLSVWGVVIVFHSASLQDVASSLLSFDLLDPFGGHSKVKTMRANSRTADGGRSVQLQEYCVMSTL